MAEGHDEVRWGLGPLQRFRIGPTEELLVQPGSGLRAILPVRVAGCLEQLHGFRTISDHAEAIAARVPGHPPDVRDLRVLLSRLAKAGFLVRWVNPSHAASREPGVSSRIRTVAFASCNRPLLLVRALTSMADNCRAYGRAPEYLVADDSRGELSGAATRTALLTFARRSGCALLYAGLSEKQRIAAVLARVTRVPREVIDFALFGAAECDFTGGANRNSILLLTADSLAFLADDDTMFRAAVPANAERGLLLTGRFDPRTRDFFPHRSTAARSLIPARRSILDEHERMLGRPVFRIMADCPPPHDFTALDAAQCSVLARGHMRVRVTVTGLYGHSGVKWPTGLLVVEGASHDNLLASEQAYDHARSTAEVTKTVQRLTIVPGGIADFIFSGLDNREATVPFMPVLRSEDTLWANTIRIVEPHSAVGFLPLAALHGPAGSRSYGVDATVRYSGEEFCHVVAATTARFANGIAMADEAGRAARLGRMLAEVAEIRQRPFEEFLRSCLLAIASQRIVRIDQALAMYPQAPEAWRRDVEQQRHAIVMWMLEGDVMPFDLVETAGTRGTPQLARTLLARYGELLQAWPVLFRAACDNREEIRSELTAITG